MLNDTMKFLRQEQGDGVWYIASPYSAWADAAGLQAAADEVGRTCNWLIDQGVHVFSPIAHSHAICRAGGSDPLDHERWLAQDLAIAQHAVGLIVIEMEGWESSVGVTAERGWFEEWGRTIVHVPPVGPSRKEAVFRDDETILEEAARLTSGDRQRDYDHPLPNHERIARLWQAYLDGRNAGPLTPVDAAWMMLLVKVARDQATPKRDNATDAAGYARCIERIRAAQGLPDYAP